MSERTLSTFQKRGKGGLGGALVEQLVQNVQTIDPDVWLMMDQRDSRLIEEEILHGAASSKYVYSFKMAGNNTVSGISVVGARELAAHYGGIRHTLVASISKVGSLFVMKSYPHNGAPIGLFVQHIKELAAEPDYYEVLTEIEDMKTGNRVQVEKRENRFEKRSRHTQDLNPNTPEEYERPHYQTIAGSKAYRNGVLSIIPQHVQLQWKEEMLKLNKTEVITSSPIDEKRSGVLRYAASKAIPVDRDAVEALTFDQISGLSDAAREGKTDGFAESARALGIIIQRESPPERTNGAGKVQQIAPKPTPPRAVAPVPTPAPVEEAEKPPRATRAEPEVVKPEPFITLESEGITELEAEIEAVEQQHDDQEAPGDEEEGGIYAVDEDGNDQIFPTEMAFAEWFVAQMKTARDPDKLRHMNEDCGSLSEAMKDPEARAILAPPPPAQAEPPKAQAKPAPTAPASLLVPVPMGPQAPIRYINAVRASLATCSSKAMVENWRAINQPVYNNRKYNAPNETGVGRIDAIINDRIAELNAPNDPDMEQARVLLNLYSQITTKEQLNALVSDSKWRSYVAHVRTHRHDDIFRMLQAEDMAVAERVGIPRSKPTSQRSMPLNDEPPLRDTEHD